MKLPETLYNFWLNEVTKSNLGYGMGFYRIQIRRIRYRAYFADGPKADEEIELYDHIHCIYIHRPIKHNIYFEPKDYTVYEPIRPYRYIQTGRYKIIKTEFEFIYIRQYKLAEP